MIDEELADEICLALGVKLTGQSTVEKLTAAVGSAQAMAKAFAYTAAMVDFLIVTMQASCIECDRGEGPVGAMEWIENTLSGPGNLPDPNDGRSAQEYFEDEAIPPWDENFGRLAGRDA